MSEDKKPIYYIFWAAVSIIAIVEIERIIKTLKGLLNDITDNRRKS
jgi:hypothetical protein